MARSSARKQPHSKKKRALRKPAQSVESQFDITSEDMYLGRKRGIKVPNKTIKNRK